MRPLDALQATLEAEHAALYVYGTLGAQTSRSAQPTLWTRVSSGYAVHRARRDRLVAAIGERGADPVAAAVAYELPNAVADPGQITAAALTLEDRCAEVYADLVGSTSGADRRWAVEALTDAAVRRLGFQGSPETFPGVDELTDR